MDRVRCRDTKPEMAVRRLVHSLGFRYRLHNSDLPGKPALSFQPAEEQLGKELIGDILPFLEKNYRVLPDREHRAITGLSMGGGQAFTIGMKNLVTLTWVGEFSSGLVSTVGFDVEKQIPGIFKDPSALNKRLRLLFLSCGTDDPRYSGQLDLVDAFKNHDIRQEFHATPGGHEWKVWRHLLAEFLQEVFTGSRIPS
jgi:enterochelin esterase-like enzyme